MAKARPKQFDPSRTSHSKSGFDGEEDGWVLVKKQRVIIVLPSLPPPQHFTVENPEISLSQAELRDVAAVDTRGSVVVPSLPLPQHYSSQKPATSHSQAELRDSKHESTSLNTVVPSPPVTQHYALQNPVASWSQAELRECIADTQETTPVHTEMSSLPETEHYALQKPATQADVHTLVHAEVPSCPLPTLQKHSTSQLAETPKDTPVHTVVPSLPVTDTLQKPATSQSQAEQGDYVSDTLETTRFHAVETEACPDFTAVDKPEMARSRNPTARKAPAGRRPLQDHRMGPNWRSGIRSRSHKPIRFPRVMCSSVVMDNEKLRVVNLEKKVERAGGLNEWVGSIGLGREFERMLRGQRMSKFQVANLTMEKLKQMGALAVGPRRKLIHAIQCVYHPHCLRASSFN